MELINNIDAETNKLEELANDLEGILGKNMKGKGDRVMQKLIELLRSGDAYSAKVFLGNEMDKFDWYREDAVPLIIEKLYGGSGSPWITIERKLKTK